MNDAVLNDDRFFFGVWGDHAREQTPGLTVMLENMAAHLAERLPGLLPADHIHAEARIGDDGMTLTLTAKTEEGRRALLWFATGSGG